MRRSGVLSRTIGLAMLMALGLAGLAMSATQDGGQLQFNNACRTCHSVKEGDNRLGPNLHGIVGRQAGSLPDYAYSESMKNAGLIWDEPALDRFLADPEGVVRGNKMKPFGGIASAEERAKLIAYLKSGAT
jgi:cytochrome c